MTRAHQLRGLLEPGEAMLVTNSANIRYLTGFTGSYGAALVTPDDLVLVTDSRYRLQAAQECPDARVEVSGDLLAAAQAAGIPLAIEAAHLTVAQHERLVTGMRAPVRSTIGAVETLRAVKDTGEIAAIRQACAIAVAALSDVVTQVRPGMTERELAVRLERRMVDLGAQDRAFPSIVAAGEHSAIPHHSPTDRPLQRGDLLKIDFGARVDGYHSDCTRVFTVGPAADWQLEVHAAVLAAQLAALDLVAADAALADVDRAARVAVAGRDGAFEHGLGHGVGLAVHEDPFFRPRAEGRLARDAVVTVEPGLYLPQRGGVRIEDTVLVTEGGFECLTVLPTELTDIA